MKNKCAAETSSKITTVFVTIFLARYSQVAVTLISEMRLSQEFHAFPCFQKLTERNVHKANDL
jgi:hypothetical protein